MTQRAAITVSRPREEIERLWTDPEHRSSYLADLDAAFSFADAPGDRGTEIHVELRKSLPGGKVGETVAKVVSMPTLSKVKDELRRFKQRVETGETALAQAGA
jgi:hypothetical protein